MKIKICIIVGMLCINISSCQDNYEYGFDYRNFDNTPVKELAKAVKDEKLSEISKLIKKEKLNVNYKEPIYGNSVLSVAVVKQSVEVVELLLKLGANPNSQEPKWGTTPFINALTYTFDAKDCNNTKVKLLIKYGAKVNMIINDKANNRIYTPLMLAAEDGCLSNVKTLIENGADINFYPKEYGNGAITSALIQDELEIVKYLIIEKKAQIPDYIFVQRANINYAGEPDAKLTITDMLQSVKFSNNDNFEKDRDEILKYLMSIGKK